MYEKSPAYSTPNAVIATDESGLPAGPRSQIVLANSTSIMQTIAVSESVYTPSLCA